MTITYPRLGRNGRIGNQLWEIASTIGLAESRGDKPSFPAWDYQSYFRIPDSYFTNESGIDASTLVPHMDERCASYLQDYNLFANVAPTIKAMFQPSDRALEEMNEKRFDWFWDLEDPISLHVRRGDNVTHPEGYHPLVTTAYYERALALAGSGPVVVFSDDLPWCREVFRNTEDVFFFDGNPARPPDYDLVSYLSSPPSDWLDLQFMASTRGPHIISNSTYGWWGAFLSDDPSPFYPTTWFGWRLTYIDWKLLIPADWRGIEC